MQLYFVRTEELREAGSVVQEEDQEASFGPFSLTGTVPLRSLAQLV